MSTTHHCEWTPPITNLERFSLWSTDVQKLLDHLPHYVASGRKQRIFAIPFEEYTKRRRWAFYTDFEAYSAQHQEALFILPDQQELYKKLWQKNQQHPHYALIIDGPGGTDPLIIRGPEGTGNPIITDEEVAFNIDISEGDYHDPFRLRKGDLIAETFEFWKTPWSPHNLLVMAALIRLAYHFPFPEIIITSDQNSSHWWEASILCQQVFGIGTIPVQSGH